MLASFNGLEDVFNLQLKKARQAERQLQAGIITPRLYGVDRLAGDMDPGSQVCLGPVAPGTQEAQLILHSSCLERKSFAANAMMTMNRAMYSLIGCGKPGMFSIPISHYKH